MKKKKRMKGKKVGQAKFPGAGLEGFVNWVNPSPPTGEIRGVHLVSQIPSEPAEVDMSSLVTGFAAPMRKRVASAQGETTPDSDVPGGKRPKWSGPDEEAQKSPTVITVDSSERAYDALPALEGAAQDASREACPSLEDGTLVGGPPNADQVVNEAPFVGTTIGLPLLARRSCLATFGARKARLPDRLVLGSYVKPMEWARPSTDMSALGPDAAMAARVYASMELLTPLAYFGNSMEFHI